MARSFSLGYKKPSCWSSLEVGIGSPLTDARIRHYIREGKYTGFTAPRKRTVGTAVKKDRVIRKLVDEYNSIA